MKKLFNVSALCGVLVLTALVLPLCARAYDFSAVAPSGQTLYYNIVNGTAQVTCQNGILPLYSTYPAGALTIPNTVTYNGTTYPVTSIDRIAFYDDTTLTSVTIPNSVTSIGYSAFYGCSGLTSVTIPNSVTDIGTEAFHGCSALTSVTIPNSVTYIGGSAFAGCSSLTSVTIPNSLTRINDNTFAGCSRLTSVTIPNSVTDIGGGAFSNCSGLTSVTLGGSVITIGNAAFYYCSALTSVTIPNSVTTIGGQAFAGCSSLTSVAFGNSVTSIGSSAFNSCSGLTSVTIPASVTNIGGGAFYYCRGLREITCLATGAPTLGDDVFYNVSSTIPVYIPCGSRSSYASRWTYFSNFNENFIYTLNVQSADTTMGTVAITTQPSCSTAAVVTATADSGYRFYHWNDGNTHNPRTLPVTQNTTLIAFFLSANGCTVVHDTIWLHDTIVIYDTVYIAQEGINGVGGMNAKVYSSHGQIVVEGSEGNAVTLYDMTGRILATKNDSYSALRFDIPASGTYLIRIGTLPARKVIVVK